MEDVITLFYFLIFYFFLQSTNKGIESLEQTQIFKPLEQTQIFKPLEPDVVSLWYFKFRRFDLTEFIVWNI